MAEQADRQQQWQNILQLTGQLKQMSADADWEAMPELESKRQLLLKDYFAQAVSAEEAESIALDIQVIMQANQQMIQQGHTRQGELIGAVKQFSTNRKAISAYHTIQK